MFGWFGLGRNARDDFTRRAMELMDSLYSTAVRMTGDPKDAEDLVQDAYLRAYRFKDKFEEGTNLKAWMFKIMTNVYINRYRRGRKEKDLLIKDFDFSEIESRFIENWSASDLSRVDLPFNEGMSDEVRQAFEELPQNFRAVVDLVDLQELSYAEAAQILDCPIGTVMSRLSRGRRLLKKALADYAYREGVIRQSDVREDRHGERKIDDPGERRRSVEETAAGRGPVNELWNAEDDDLEAEAVGAPAPRTTEVVSIERGKRRKN